MARCTSGYLSVRAAARHVLAEALLMRNAAEHVLIKHAGRGVEQARRTAALLEGARHLFVDVAVHAVDDFRPERGFGDVGVDVDDEIIVAPRFLGGVRQNLARIGRGRDLRQLGDARAAVSVLVAVLAAVTGALLLTGGRLRHGFLQLVGGASRAPGLGRKPNRTRARCTRHIVLLERTATLPCNPDVRTGRTRCAAVAD